MSKNNPWLGGGGNKKMDLYLCYGLVLECSPKVCVLNRLVLRVVLLRDCEIFKRWGLLEVLVTGDEPLKETAGHRSFGLFSSQGP